jgi:hypothetical protein
MRPSWRERHRQAAAEIRKQQGIAKEASGSSPETRPEQDASVHWQSAKDMAKHQGLAAAVPLLRRVLEREPSHNGASVLLGRHFLTCGDLEGERLLEGVIQRNNESWLPQACEQLEKHYRSIGQADRVRQTRERLDRHEADLAAAQRERSKVTARDRFLQHEMTSDAVLSLRTRLASFPEVGSAWLARKDLRYFPHRQLFVLCVRSISRRGWWSNAEKDQALVRQLSMKIRLPAQVLVIAARGSFRSLAKTIISVPHSQVYAKNS